MLDQLSPVEVAFATLLAETCAAMADEVAAVAALNADVAVPMVCCNRLVPARSSEALPVEV